MNNSRLQSSALVAVAVSLLAACASTAQVDAEKRASDVKIYGLGTVTVSQYEVVSRPWVDSSRSAYSLPTYPTEEQAIAALQTEAARRGADGLTNVTCLNQSPPGAEPAILCYGTGIRLRPGKG
jgi:hypothetical protein